MVGLLLAAASAPAASADTAADLQTIGNDGPSISEYIGGQFGTSTVCDALCTQLGNQLAAAGASTAPAVDETLTLGARLAGLAIPGLNTIAAAAAAGYIVWKIGSWLFGSDPTPSASSYAPFRACWVGPTGLVLRNAGGGCSEMINSGWHGAAWVSWIHCVIPCSQQTPTGLSTTAGSSGSFNYVEYYIPMTFRKSNVTGNPTPTFTSPAGSNPTASATMNELTSNPTAYADFIHQAALAHAAIYKVIPIPGPTETAGAYASRLGQLGLQTTTSTLTESDPDTADGAVAETNPDPGTTVQVGTTVDIAANPSSATVSQPDPRCDINNGTGTVGDPGDPPSDGTNYPAYQLVEASPYPAATDPSGSSPAQTQIPLRWGTTRWGWRHVLQEHPYTTQDRDQTMQALATDSTPTPTGFTSRQQWDFHLFYSMPDGSGGNITCVRTARVEYYQDSQAAAAGVQGIRGIQNSFTGLYLGGIPGR